MAEVTIAGNSYVIASAFSMEDLETIKKYRPSVLAITDPQTKETLFRIGLGSNSISEYGVSFGGVSNDVCKLATATLSIPQGIEDKKEYVLDKIGQSLANLGKIETEIEKALIDIHDERNTAANSIKVSV